MKINSMFFIAMCGLCISCGAEITTDTSSEILSDRQIPIGISTVAVPEYGAETTRGLIANATYQLGLFRTGDKGYPPQYDAPYTYTETGWTASTEVKVDHREVSLYAYYPYQSVSFVDNTTTAVLNAQLYSVDKDMCYGKGLPVGSASMINNDAPEVEFTAMKHAYARLKLTLLRGTNYDKSKVCNIKNITLKSNNTDFYPQRHLDITTAAGATEGTAVTTGYVYNPNVNIAIGEQSSYDFLLPPQPLAGSTLTVLVTVDDEVRFLNIAGLGSSLDAGAYYNVSLTITDIQMVLTNALTVNDYGTQGNTNFDYKYEMHN